MTQGRGLYLTLKLGSRPLIKQFSIFDSGSSLFIPFIGFWDCNHIICWAQIGLVLNAIKAWKKKRAVLSPSSHFVSNGDHLTVQQWQSSFRKASATDGIPDREVVQTIWDKALDRTQWQGIKPLHWEGICHKGSQRQDSQVPAFSSELLLRSLFRRDVATFCHQPRDSSTMSGTDPGITDQGITLKCI